MIYYLFIYLLNNNKYLLLSPLSSVHKEANLDSCVNYIKLLPSSSTLLLIELDDSTSNNKHVELITNAVQKVSESVPVIGKKKKGRMYTVEPC
jgi:hypothetical protein